MKTKKISFTVYGEPYGKKNMQPRMINGHASQFQPSTNTQYMYRVQSSYLAQTDKEEWIISTNAQIEMRIDAFYSIPKNTPKYKVDLMKADIVRPTKKPDCDNISKVICDAMSKMIMPDDAQITDLLVSKHYTATEPRVEIKMVAIELEKGEDY